MSKPYPVPCSFCTLFLPRSGPGQGSTPVPSRARPTQYVPRPDARCLYTDKRQGRIPHRTLSDDGAAALVGLRHAARTDGAPASARRLGGEGWVAPPGGHLAPHLPIARAAKMRTPLAISSVTGMPLLSRSCLTQGILAASPSSQTTRGLPCFLTTAAI